MLQVAATETLRLLPVIIIRVTDENGLSVGPGVRGINLLGRQSQVGVAVRFGGETGVSATVDVTTITPGTWTRHIGFSYTSRENTLYDFDERATTADVRIARNWRHGLRTGAIADVLAIDTGLVRRVAVRRWHGHHSDARRVRDARHAGLVHQSASRDLGRSRGRSALRGCAARGRSSWTDGRFQRLTDRHGLGLFSLATFQTGEVGVQLPDYLQFDLGGANTIRGWSLGSRRGRNQFIGTAEYTYVVQPVRAFTVKGLNLYAGLQVVGFADLGQGVGRRRRSGLGVGHRRLRHRASAPRAVCRRDSSRPRMGRAGSRRDGLLRRVAQGRATTPAGSMTRADDTVSSFMMPARVVPPGGGRGGASRVKSCAR